MCVRNSSQLIVAVLVPTSAVELLGSKCLASGLVSAFMHGLKSRSSGDASVNAQGPVTRKNSERSERHGNLHAQLSAKADGVSGHGSRHGTLVGALIG